MKHGTILLLSGLFIISACAMVWAQATARIGGTVKDQSGAILPGVEITATQSDTGIVRTAITNETGSYVLTNLPIGPYRLEAALSGFRAFVQTGIVLQVDSSPTINVALEVGQVTEQVEVQANAAAVETESVGVGEVIENTRILELPLNGRQVTDLVALAGAAVPTTIGLSDLSMPGSASISVAGGYSSGTVYILDGSLHNNAFDNASLPLPFPDALQEFKVETGARSAQYGMYSGATVNSVTKSGTNEWHGDLFEFVRNDLFNARNYFATTHSTLKRNQFGGTLGGPIEKKTMFFFFGYQPTTIRQDPANSIDFVPTAAMLNGDFTAFTSPACNSGRQINLSAPFVGNRVDPGLFSKPAVTLVQKLPQTPDPCGKVTYGVQNKTNQGQVLGRVDYQLSANQTLFGRYLATIYSQAVPYTLDPNLLNSRSMGYDDLAQSYAFGDTYLISPNTVNAFHLAVNRTAITRLTAKFFSSPELGLATYSPPQYPHEMNFSVSGAFSLGGTAGPNRTTTYQMSDDLSLIRGTHQIAFGVNMAHWRDNFLADAYSLGNWQFNGQVTGLPLADLLVGRPSQFQQAADNGTRMSEWYFGLYAADAWKVAPRLTMDYGVRWEPGLPITMRDGQVASFDEGRYAAGIRSSMYKNAPAGLYYPGDPGFPGSKCRSSGVCLGNDINTRWKNIAPRLGFAWDPRGDGHTSIRASYAMAYDIRTGSFYQSAINPPWVSNIIIPTPAGGFENPWLGYPGGNPFPLPQLNSNVSFPAFGNYNAIPSNSPSSTRQSWNLSFQRQVGTDWLVSTTYIGSNGTHMWIDHELNPALYVPGNCQAGQYGLTAPGACSTTANTNFRRRLLTSYPNVSGTTMSFLGQYEATGTSNYNGVLASVQRRAAKGVTVGGNYTWSHCISDRSPKQTGGSGQPGVTYQDPNNRAFDRGNCAWDVRHIFNTTTVVETPKFATSALRIWASGWKISGIFRATTGAFLSVTSGQDRQLSGVSAQRALQISPIPYGKKTLTNYLNAAAFTLPPLGTLGNMRPLSIAGPGGWDLDMAISRIFQVRENQRIEARVEAFNVTNSLRPGPPVSALNNSTFGQITTALDPRILEFALKYVF